MTGLQQQEHNNGSIPPFRLDVQLHELLNKPPERPTLMSVPSAQPLTLPEPVFPQRPELLTDEELKIDKHGSPDDPYKRHWPASLVYRCLQGWMFPYIKSRVLPGDFHPIIAYLFTEWKCNLDCHYCWAFDNIPSRILGTQGNSSIAE